MKLKKLIKLLPCDQSIIITSAETAKMLGSYAEAENVHQEYLNNEVTEIIPLVVTGKPEPILDVWVMDDKEEVESKNE